MTKPVEPCACGVVPLIMVLRTGAYRIECRNNRCESDAHVCLGWTRAEAIAKWNKRAKL